MPRDIVERLRDRAYIGLPDPLLAEAADEIDRLRNGAVSGVPDPDSRVWETPCTPQPHAIPAKGSAQGDGSVRDSRNANEPAAWAVMPRNCDYCVTLSTRREAAQKAAERKVEVGEYATMDDIAVVPLYRHPQPTLTETETETLRELRDEAAQYADEIGLCSSEVRMRQRIIDSMLERMK